MTRSCNEIVLAGFDVVQPTPADDLLYDVADKREGLLRNLLVLLNSATDLGVVTSIAEFEPMLNESVISARELENR